jgi:hypothetical protein
MVVVAIRLAFFQENQVNRMSGGQITEPGMVEKQRNLRQ